MICPAEITLPHITKAFPQHVFVPLICLEKCSRVLKQKRTTRYEQSLQSDVSEGSNQHDAACGDVRFFHAYPLRKKRSGSSKPMASPMGIGKGIG